MLRRAHLLSAVISLSLLGGQAVAQSTQQGAQPPAAAPPVTASADGAGARFTAPEGVSQVRLEIYTQAGERVFDTGMRPGSVLDWKAADARLADGSYLAVLTVKDLRGKLSQRVGSLSLQAGQVSLSRGVAASAAQAQALSAERQARKIEQADDEALTVVTTGKERALTLSTHDGRDGQVASTSGSLTFGTGDVLTGASREQMRVTPEGRVGIGTAAPEDTLDVAGTIRARGGIRFDDGTVLTSASGVKSSNQLFATSAAAPSDGQTAAALAGTGTVNRLSKWMDGSGTLGDSAILETNGLTVFGRTTPLFPNASDYHLVEMAAPGTKTPLTLVGGSGSAEFWKDTAGPGGGPSAAVSFGMAVPGAAASNDIVFSAYNPASGWAERLRVAQAGNVGIGVSAPASKLTVAGDVRVMGAGSGIIFADGSKLSTAPGGGPVSTPSGTSIVSAINDPTTAGLISEARLSPNVAKLNGANTWSGANVFGAGLSANNSRVTNVGNPVNAGDATNKAYVDASFVKFVPGAEQLSVGDANGTAPMINLRGGSTCCSGPGGHTPAWFKVFQNGSFVATGNLGIGVSPMQGKGYRTSWDSYKGAFRSGYADNEWDDANVGFFSWAGGSNSTAIGLYALAFGDTNSAESTSSIVFGSGNQVKGAAGFSAGAGNRVCDTYGVAFGNKAQSGGPLINGKCDPDTFNIRGLAAVAIGYNVTADQDHTTAMGKFASNNGFTGTFIWSDGAAQQSADTFRNTANNEFAARATGGFRFRTNLGGTTGCNLPAGSGVFNCTSSRTTKENFFDVNGDDVLARLRKVPVSTWNYISEGSSARHLGPMAEDFYSAFQLGTSDKAIGVQDAVGVSLAAVKALDARTLELQQKTEEVEQLRSKVNTLEQRLAALEALVQKQGEGQEK